MKLSAKGRVLVAAQVMLIPLIAMAGATALVVDITHEAITTVHRQHLHHIQTE